MTKIRALGKKLKSSNVELDIVSFGEVEQNERFLKELRQTAGGSGTFLTVAPGTKLIADCVMVSPIVLGEAGVAASPAAGFDAGMDFGGGFEDDPELARAIAESLRDEQLRLEKASKSQQPASASQAAEPAATGSSETVADESIMADEEEMNEDLLAALQMSMLETPSSRKPNTSEPPPAPVKKAPTGEGEEGEDAAMTDTPQKSSVPPQAESSDGNQVFTDDFVGQLLSSVGVNVTDLGGLPQQPKPDEKKDDDDSMTDKDKN